MKIWESVRRHVGVAPVVHADLAGTPALHVERFVLQRPDLAIPGYDILALVVVFGGARVREGRADQWRTTSFPQNALLIPPKCPTRWQFGGASDYATFYFADPDHEITRRFARLASDWTHPRQFSEPLVTAAASQICAEIQRGSLRDDRFISNLISVMLEQAYRSLSSEDGSRGPLNHTYFRQTQKARSHIREHLAGDLSVKKLATIVGLSETHFRRVFKQALGSTVHQYVQAQRLAHAQTLLATTALPLAVISERAGFSSQSHLTACFKATHCVTPSIYRKSLKS